MLVRAEFEVLGVAYTVEVEGEDPQKVAKAVQDILLALGVKEKE